MSTSRLEAFSDGVIAILITIMVLDLHVPHDSHLADLRPVGQVFFCYLLSFVNLGIYWNNHHHLLRATERINGAIMWANLHLLFWLSLFPFVTGWMGENHFDAVPTAVYGAVNLCSAIAYYILVRTIVREHGSQSAIAAALGADLKGKVSPAIYASGIPLAFASRWVALACYITVALIWLVPDRRMATLQASDQTSA
jgi:uncharacterized membrane protein